LLDNVVFATDAVCVCVCVCVCIIAYFTICLGQFLYPLVYKLDGTLERE